MHCFQRRARICAGAIGSMLVATIWIAVVTAMSVAATLCQATAVHPAHSSVVPSVVAVARPTDPAILRLRIDQPDARVWPAIAADIDADGDVDVVAASVDQGPTIWINDGLGHFARRRPRPGTAIATHDQGVAEPSEGESCSTPPPTPSRLSALAARCWLTIPSLPARSSLPIDVVFARDQLVVDRATRGPPRELVDVLNPERQS